MDQRELYYQVAKDSHLSQEGLNRDYYIRAGTVLTFGGALVGAGALVLNLGAASECYWDIAAFGLLLVMFTGVVVAACRILIPYDWLAGPELSDIQEFLTQASQTKG